MASPVYSAGTPGNVINAIPVVHSNLAIAAYLDLSACVEGQVTCEVITPSPAPTTLTAFSIYKAYAAGSAAPITLTSSAASGQKVISISSKTGLSAGQTFCIQKAGAPPQFGELAIVSSITGSSSPYTLTVANNLINGYSASDNIYTMAQTASFTAQPSNSSGAYASGADYSTEIFLGPGQWIVAALNSDSNYNVTANVTVDKVTGFA